MEIENHPEWPQIEAHMQASPAYNFLMSYRFENCVLVDTHGAAFEYAYSDEPLTSQMFKALLEAVYKDRQIADASILSQDFYKRLANYILATMSFQVAIDKVVPTLRDANGWNGNGASGKSIRYSYWLDACKTSSIFAGSGTAFRLDFECRAHEKINTCRIGIWIEPQDSLLSVLPQDLMAFPIRVSAFSVTRTIQFKDLKRSLLLDILRDSIDFKSWK